MLASVVCGGMKWKFALAARFSQRVLPRLVDAGTVGQHRLGGGCREPDETHRRANRQPARHRGEPAARGDDARQRRRQACQVPAQLGGQSCAAGVLVAETAASGVKGMRNVINKSRECSGRDLQMALVDSSRSRCAARQGRVTIARLSSRHLTYCGPLADECLDNSCGQRARVAIPPGMRYTALNHAERANPNPAHARSALPTHL